MSLGALVADALRGHGHRVAAYTDGQIALTELRARVQDFDLLISDIDQPALAGEALAAAARAAGYVRPIVWCAGAPHALAPRRLAELDIHAVLPKPVALPTLLAAVGSAVTSA